MVRSRLAPTPSGYLHLGNAFNFILTWLLTRSRKGTLYLRIDDLDTPRVRREYLEEIFDALSWLGLDYDAGPRHSADLKNAWSQQLRLPQYQEMLERLVQTGRVYACKCSRKDLEATGAKGCPCQSLHFSLEEKDVAWRFQTMPEDAVIFTDENLGLQHIRVQQANPNFVVRRKDGLPAYHIASLADDEALGINLIVRGVDLLESTATQLLLAKCLQLNHFQEARFYHHPLIKSAAGDKLSKSAGAASLKKLRESAQSPAFLYRQFCDWLHLPFSADNAKTLLEAVVERNLFV